MSRLVCNYLNFGDLAPMEAIEAAGAGGFRASGVRLTGHTPGNGDPGLINNASALRNLAQCAAHAGVALAVANTYRILGERRIKDYAPVLDACGRLGVGALAINCFDPVMDRAADLIGMLAAAAMPYGMSVALEFIPVSTVPTFAAAVALMRATGQPNVGINVDALHLHRSGGTPDDLALAPELIASIHLCDAPAAAPDDLFAEMRAGRLFPGEGELPLHALLDAGPAGVELEIEVPNAALSVLPPSQRARRIHDAGMQFLARHAARSSFSHAAGQAK